MTPITSIDQVTCEFCIWSKTFRIDGIFCLNQPPPYNTQNCKPNSFCNQGLWPVHDYNTGIKLFNKPNSILFLLNKDV